MDFKTEFAKITEAYCLENGIPIQRKFSDAELAASVENLRDCKVVAERIEAEARAAGLKP
jgi:mRNA-degrading endonuclease YafQ of YafQ-DinJ toxin-antitoxin module